MFDVLETCASYLPVFILKRLENDPTPFTSPFGEQFPAALFVADISGFTALTEQLVHRGPDGVEELSIILNAYFGLLIDLVLDHGGDIVEFTGDGIIAVWPTPLSNEDLPTLTYRAAQCGLLAQQMLHGYTSGDGVRLSLRIGIGAGDVLAATIGGMLGRWELLLAGEPLAQVSAAQEMASSGNVVLSPYAWFLIRDQCIAYPMCGRHRVADSSGFFLEQVRGYLPPCTVPPVVLHPAMSVAMRSYLPGALLARLDAGQSDWVAELRRVTILFVNIAGINYNDPDIVSRLQEIMLSLQTDLYHYEGSLNQFIVDDKGTLLIAAFGLPPLTHEDDPVRGVQFALDIHTHFHHNGLPVSIGVATGRIFCGSRGSDRRHDYAMIGNAMNLAARLMQAAPGDIRCDAATFQAAQALLTFDTLPPIHVKGWADPVPVYRPHGPLLASVCQKTPMVGRSAEQQLLHERLHALIHEQQGSVVVIEGEAGMGKSRLVDHMLEQSQNGHITTLVGRGSAIEQSTLYAIWHDVFIQLFHLYHLLDNPEAAQRQVMHVLHDDTESSRLAPLLNVVLPLHFPDNEITSRMSGQVRADNTRELLLRLLQTAAAQSPTMIILEDANWMDSSSWELTIAVSQHISSLLLVITTRPLTDPVSGVAMLRGSLEFELSRIPEGGQPGWKARSRARQTAGRLPSVAPSPPQPMGKDHAEYGHLLKRPDAYHLVLNALSPPDTANLVCECLKVSQVPDRVAAVIAEKAQGNPFFSQELAYAMRDAGLVVVADGVCRVSATIQDFSALKFPDTVQGVIISRIDRLAQSHQLTLKVASVIGHIFAFRILHDIHPIEPDRPELPNHLHTFERLDIVLLEKPEPELLYAFKHVITREVVYDLLLYAQRRELHRAAAEWYERTYRGDLSLVYELLAYHWDKAEVETKAMYYAEKAGEHALQNFANQEAVYFFTQALARLEKLPVRDHERIPGEGRYRISENRLRRASLERQLGEAFLGLGNLPESRRHLERAAALIGRPVPGNRLILIERIVRQTMRQLLHRIHPPDTESVSLKKRLVRGNAAYTYGLLTSVYYLTNESFLGIYASLCCLNLLERSAGYSQWHAYAYANMCMVAGSIHLAALAETYGRQALDVAWQMGDVSALIYALNLNGLYRVGVGNLRQAQGALELAVQLCERIGDWSLWGTNWTLLAQVHYYQGRFVDSSTMFTQLAEAARHRDNRLHRAWALGGQGQSLLRLGRLDEACTLLEEAITMLVENDEVPSQISNYGLLALARLRQDAWPQAQAAAEMALRLIDRIPMPTAYYLIEGYAGIAEVFIEQWEMGSALPAGERDVLSQRAVQASRNLCQFASQFPIAQPRALLWHGMCEWLMGRQQQAYQVWHRSLAVARRFAMPYEAGLAHAQIGRHRQGDARRYHLQQACRLFAQVGAAWELERTTRWCAP